jgi:hypothetical protein
MCFDFVDFWFRLKLFYEGILLNNFLEIQMLVTQCFLQLSRMCSANKIPHFYLKNVSQYSEANR